MIQIIKPSVAEKILKPTLAETKRYHKHIQILIQPRDLVESAIRTKQKEVVNTFAAGARMTGHDWIDWVLIGFICNRLHWTNVCFPDSQHNPDSESI